MSDSEPTKKSIQEAWEAAKAREAEQAKSRTAGNENLFSSFSNNQTNNKPMKSETTFMDAAQGYILIGLLCVVIFLLAYNTFRTPKALKYAYKVINVQAQFNKKPTDAGVYTQSNDAAIGTTSVNLKDEELTILGNEGWELVGTFLEEETTHPNYGNSQYVTGLQPNIRPQRAVMIFRRLVAD